MFVKNLENRKILATQANICDTMLSRIKGLMFHQKIKDVAFVLAFPKEQKVALHMFFVFFPIDVLFLDREKKVVELKKGFMPFTQYAASNRAKYAVELPEGTIDATNTKVGDRIEFFEVVSSLVGKKI